MKLNLDKEVKPDSEPDLADSSCDYPTFNHRRPGEISLSSNVLTAFSHYSSTSLTLAP